MHTTFRNGLGIIKHNFTLNNMSSNGIIPNALLSNSANSKKTLDLEVNRIVWIDMEMTGLDVQKDKILEVACLVTDSDLNIVAKGENLIIHQSEDTLANMNEWCIKQHQKTGLTQASLNSKISLEDAENSLFNFVKRYVTEKQSPLAGNSVYMDKLFLQKYMPRVNDYLHYRIIDISSVKELCRRWNSEVYKRAPKKNFVHRALGDIEESVEELKFYRHNFFKTLH